jgi:hypothetical protein
MVEMEYTSIPVRPETRDRVKSLKRGGEAYDELLRRLADHYETEA